jgi:hypothetical protein
MDHNGAKILIGKFMGIWFNFQNKSIWFAFVCNNTSKLTLKKCMSIFYMLCSKYKEQWYESIIIELALTNMFLPPLDMWDHLLLLLTTAKHLWISSIMLSTIMWIIGKMVSLTNNKLLIKSYYVNFISWRFGVRSFWPMYLFKTMNNVWWCLYVLMKCVDETLCDEH